MLSSICPSESTDVEIFLKLPLSRLGSGWECIARVRTVGPDPRPSQRPNPLQQAPVRHAQGNSHPRPLHLVARHSQEVGLCDLVLEYDEDCGLRAVIVGGPMRGVVAQVGRDASGHRNGSHGPALPLQEEGPGVVAPSQDAEGVGVDRADFVLMSEVP